MGASVGDVVTCANNFENWSLTNLVVIGFVKSILTLRPCTVNDGNKKLFGSMGCSC